MCSWVYGEVMKKNLLFLFGAIFLLPWVLYAHPGGTDAYGCHTCRTNCPSWGLSTGEYHCHNAKSLPQPEEPIRSHYGDYGTGYTEPAPDYAAPIQKPAEPVVVPAVTPEVQIPATEAPDLEVMPVAEPALQKTVVPSAPTVPNVVEKKPASSFFFRLLKILVLGI